MLKSGLAFAIVMLSAIVFASSALSIISGLNRGWLVWTMFGVATFVCPVSAYLEYKFTQNSIEREN